MVNELFLNGSTWLRADFHLHTKADKQFKYDGDVDTYIQDYIGALKQAHISVGVITNHNKFDVDEFKHLRKTAQKENIWLIPGVELSVGDGGSGIHCLIVFDKEKWLSKEGDYITPFLTSLFSNIINYENEDTHCNVGIVDLLDTLNVHRKQGRDSFVIMAHVDQDKGFLHELNGSRIQAIAQNSLFYEFVLGLQKSHSRDNKNNLKQWLPDYHPAFVEGCDCKKIEDIGKTSTVDGKEQKTYIKLGDFSFEALKYVFLDSEHRIKTELPSTVNGYIKNISFEGGKLNGQTINLSSNLNCLIGIRGSGKSAIIELLRYALDIKLLSNDDDSKYKNDLIKFVLGSGGKVIVTVVNQHDEEYTIEKIYGEKEVIYGAGHEPQNCSIDGIFNRPIYFGQKDLSSKREGFESELFDRLSGNHLDNIAKITDEKRQEVLRAILDLDKHANISIDKKEIETRIADIKQKLEYYKKNGVDEKLKKQALLEKDIAQVENKHGLFKTFIDDLASLIDDYSTFFSTQIGGSEDDQEYIDKLNEIFASAALSYKSLGTVLTLMREKYAEFQLVMQGLTQKRKELSETFAEIKRQLNSNSVDPDMFLNLTRTQNTSELKLKELQKEDIARDALIKELNMKLIALNDAWLSEYRALETEVKKIGKVSQSLKISIEHKGRRDVFKQKLLELTRGMYLRTTTIENLVNGFKDFIEIYRRKEELTNYLDSDKIGEFLTRFEQNKKDLLTFRVKDKIEITYHGKPLHQHSLGQRASALILFILAQRDNDVLIIDQPEDDLDNQTIYNEVITELLSLKENMQFIFATHNANIPVLGDCEQIVACNFENDSEIRLECGSIDNKTSQKKIVGIMEGGADAFARRNRIYENWKI